MGFKLAALSPFSITRVSELKIDLGPVVLCSVIFLSTNPMGLCITVQILKVQISLLQSWVLFVTIYVLFATVTCAVERLNCFQDDSLHPLIGVSGKDQAIHSGDANLNCTVMVKCTVYCARPVKCACL